MTAPAIVRLELPEPPSANRWWRMGRSGPRGGHSHMHLSAEARAYKQVVQIKAGSAVRPITAQREWPVYARSVPVSVSIYWMRSRRAGDLDKRVGVLLDGLQGILFATDAQVVVLHAERAEAKDGVGSVLVIVAPAVGIP